MDKETLTLSDFEGSVERLIAMLQAYPSGTYLQLSSDFRRSSRIGGDPEEFDFLVVEYSK